MLQKARLLFGMFLATLGDIGTGLIVTHILIKLFHPEVPKVFAPLGFLLPFFSIEPPHVSFGGYTLTSGFSIQNVTLLYMFGVLAAVLPDFDFIAAKVMKTKNAGKEHMNYGHFPLLILPLGVLLQIFAGTFYTLLVSIPLLLHFIHDSTGGQVGRMWLWPFSHKNYQLFVSTPEGFRFAYPYYRHQWNRVQNLELKEWLEELYLTWFPISRKFLFELFWFWGALLLIVWWK